MWWSRPIRRPRFPRAGAAAAILVLASLAGCGFQPLYAPGKDDDKPALESLAATRVLPIKDRVGQQLHNLLRDRLNPSGQPSMPAYLLEIELSKRITELGIRKDETATRANLTMMARYKLHDVESKAVLMRSKSISVFWIV